MPWLKFRQYLENYIALLGTQSTQAHAYLKIYPVTLLVKLHLQLDTLSLRYHRCLRYNRGLRSKVPFISFKGNAVAPIHIHLLLQKKSQNKKHNQYFVIFNSRFTSGISSPVCPLICSYKYFAGQVRNIEYYLPNLAVVYRKY